MSKAELTPYETLLLREILSTEISELKKLSSYIDVVKDDKLNSFVSKAVDSKKSNIKSIENFIGSD